MRSITQVVLLFVYLLMVFVISRLLDMVIWYHHGTSSTQNVDPLVLSVWQLKHLLQNRGVSYSGLIEKQEFAHLVEASAELLQGEVDALKNDDSEEVAPPTTRFKTGISQLYEVEGESKDNIWLVLVIPASSKHKDSLNLYEDSWRSIRKQVAPFDIFTGIFDCKLNIKLCNNKGWLTPKVLLKLPKGARSKDEVVWHTTAFSKPELIMEWLQEVLSTHIKTINSLEDVERNWLHLTNSSTTSSYKDVRVLLLTHLFSPPLFLSVLSIKFAGRISFGIFTASKEEAESARKKLKLVDHKFPSYVIITPERKVVYGRSRMEHFNFKSMNLFLKAVQPEMNDVFLCTLVLVNMLVSLHIFQVSVRLWWKHIARCLWTVVSYNFWLFSAWLLILATYRFTLVTFLADKCLVIIRYLSLTETGAIVRSDWSSISQHPYMLFVTFFLYGWGVTWLLKRCYSTELLGETERPWWEVLPTDSHWINCFFRPITSLSRPLLTTEVELEEGIDMLIERLAVPNLWLQPVIATEYIKNLPVWRHRGWDATVPRAEAKRAVNLSSIEQEIIEKIMDGDDPNDMQCQGCQKKHAQYKRTRSSPCFRKTSRHLEKYLSTDQPLSVDKDLDNSHSFSENMSNNVLCSSCETERISRLNEDVSGPCNDIYDSLTYSSTANVSEESGDDCSSSMPLGMRHVTECAVCLEPYKWGSKLCGLPCGHSYDQKCITIWLQRDNHHCPVCRWPAYKSKHTQTHLHCE